LAEEWKWWEGIHSERQKIGGRGMKLKHFPPLLVAVGAFLDLYVSYKLADENEITAIVDCRPYMLDEHA